MINLCQLLYFPSGGFSQFGVAHGDDLGSEPSQNQDPIGQGPGKKSCGAESPENSMNQNGA